MSALYRNIGALNGLRGVAVLIVMLSHASNNGMYFWRPLNFTGSGQYGVMIFFFLSTFLLSRPFFQNNSLIYDINEWTGYMVRRVLRIVPLYYTVLIFDFFISKFYFVDGSKHSELFNHFIFKVGYNVFWTMPVEMKVYFALPFIIIALILSSKRVVILWSIGFIVSIAITLNILYTNTNSLLETFYIHQYFPCFLGGVFTSFLYAKTESYNYSLRSKKIFETVAIISTIFFLTQIPSVWSYIIGKKFTSADFILNDMRNFYKYRHLLVTIQVSILVYSLLNGIGIIRRILSSKFLFVVGTYSYGMYLVHYIVINFFVNHTSLPPTAKTILVFIATFCIALIAYKIIEKPFIDISKNISKKLLVQNRVKVNKEFKTET